MKKIILSLIVTCILFQGFGQITIGTGTSWITSGNASVVLQDMSLINSGTLATGTGSFKFTGTQNSGITGVNLPVFYILEIAKTNNAKVVLSRNINVTSSISFISGLLDVWSSKVVLSPNAYIAGETETNRIIGGTGFVEITQNMNSPSGSNPGNLGAIISSSVNLGSVTIRRGHFPQSGTGLTTSILRYYSIIPQNNSNLNATLRLKYFDAELNGQIENSLVMYQSKSSGTTWSNLSQTTRNTNTNYVEKRGVASFALQTLANNSNSNVVVVDGVTDLAFTGERKNLLLVNLQWTSQTETNLSGYRVQRRLKKEVDFSDRTFVNSMAPGGNSLSPLSYADNDINLYADTSYYRLKIVSLNGSFTYSNVIAVPGRNNNNNREAGEIITSVEGKSKTQMNSLVKKITIGPNPNNGNFFFSMNGIEKETIATLYTIDGKQISQFRIVNLQQQQVSNLRTGIYLLKVPGFETQKIIVNGSGNAVPQSAQSNNNKL